MGNGRAWVQQVKCEQGGQRQFPSVSVACYLACRLTATRPAADALPRPGRAPHSTRRLQPGAQAEADVEDDVRREEEDLKLMCTEVKISEVEKSGRAE